MNTAISKGVSSLSFAISNSASIWQTIIDYFVLNQRPTVSNLVGIGAAVVGAMIISAGESCRPGKLKSSEEEQVSKTESLVFELTDDGKHGRMLRKEK